MERWRHLECGELVRCPIRLLLFLPPHHHLSIPQERCRRGRRVCWVQRHHLDEYRGASTCTHVHACACAQIRTQTRKRMHAHARTLVRWHMRFGNATHDKPAGESALSSNRSNINNETAQHYKTAGESALPSWTYAGPTPTLDLRWPTLDLRWTYAGPTLALRWTYAGPKLDSRWTYAGPNAGLMLDLRWTYAGPMPMLDLRWT